MRSERKPVHVVAGSVAFALVAVVAAFVVPAKGGNRAAAATGVLASFDVPGFYVWTVPADVTTVTFDVYGASGGRVTDGGSPATIIANGGLGGEAIGRFSVRPGDKYEIIVGQRGGNNRGLKFGDAGNGWGHGGWGDDGNGPIYGGGGGGGASAVVIGGRGNPCVPRSTSEGFSCGYQDRIVVGGGGGGGSGIGVSGGNGGGLVGLSQEGDLRGDGPPGGTQRAGGVGDANGCSSTALYDFANQCGGFGFGGSALHYPPNTATGKGGGGGGWFGGSSGGSTNYGPIGSGGGSGYGARPALGGSFPGGLRGGNGLVVVSTP